jgi:hypothetical protein
MLSNQQRIIFYFILLSIAFFGGGTYAILQWIDPFTHYETAATAFRRKSIFMILIGLYLSAALLLSYFGKRQAFEKGERKGFVNGAWLAIAFSVIAATSLLYFYPD